MNSPRISVIVPVYNSEKTLPCCIESILAQTFIDFELILIDDGSRDLSGRICEDYADKDSRVKVIHKNNGGGQALQGMLVCLVVGESGWLFVILMIMLALIGCMNFLKGLMIVI